MSTRHFEEVGGLGRHQPAGLVVTGNPEGIGRRQIVLCRVEDRVHWQIAAGIDPGVLLRQGRQVPVQSQVDSEIVRGLFREQEETAEQGDRTVRELDEIEERGALDRWQFAFRFEIGWHK